MKSAKSGKTCPYLSGSAAVLWILIILACISSCRPAQRPHTAIDEPERERLRELIQRLNDRDASRRQKAAVELGSRKARMAVGPLIEALKDRDVLVRADAAWALGEINDSSALKPLIRLLRNSHETAELMAAHSGDPSKESRQSVIEAAKEHNIVARRAVEALSKFNDPAIVEPLIEALSHRDRMVRAGAAKALGAYCSETAVRPVVKLLKDPVSDVRQGARSALIALGSSAVVPLMETLLDDSMADEAAQTLASIGGPAVEPLGRLMNDKNNGLRIRAASVLARICTPEAAEHLGPVVYDPSPKLRKIAIEGLACSKDSLAPVMILSAVGDRDTDVRKAASDALSRMGNVPVGALLYGLDSRDHNLREVSASLLGETKERRAVSILSVLAARDPEWRVRAAAVRGLGRIGDIRAKDALLAALNDTEASVRMEASRALTLLTGKDLGFDGRKWRDWFNEDDGNIGISMTLLPAEKNTEAVISSGTLRILSENPVVRSLAAWEIGKTGDPRAARTIVGLLQDQDAVVRWTVLKALEQLKSPDSVHAVIQGLSDSHWIVRSQAADTLGTLRDIRATEHLITSLHDENDAVRIAAVRALGETGDSRAFEPLRRLYNESRRPLRTFALIAMKKIDPPAAEPILDRELTLLKDALSSREQWVRIEAASAMGMLKDARAVDALAAAMNDPLSGTDVRNSAMLALVETGAPAADVFIETLKTGDRESRSIALHALDNMKHHIPAESIAAALSQQNHEILAWIRSSTGNEAHDNMNEALLMLLKDDRPDVRKAAGLLMSTNIDEDRISKLDAAMKDGPESTRVLIAEILGRLGHPKGIAVLLSALKDRAESVRRAAQKALNEFRGPLPASLFIHAIKDESPIVRLAAVQGLSKASGPEAVPFLIDALRDRHEDVRTEAAKVLGNKRDATSIESLISALGDRSYIVRRTAADALISITGMNFGLIRERWHAWWQESGKTAAGSRQP